MKGWNLKMGLPNHLCLVKSWLRFACQLQLAKLCFQTESQLLINILCKWIWHSLEILAVSSNQDIRIYKIYCIFVIGIHVELRLFGYSDFSWNIQICNPIQLVELELWKKHIFIHSGEKPHKCTQCDYASSQAPTLSDHIKTHSLQRPFQCKFCDFSSIQKKSLTEHLLTHSGEKPHHCKECGSSFSQAQYLKTHLHIHTGEKPEMQLLKWRKKHITRHSTND